MQELGRESGKRFPGNFFAQWQWVLGQLEKRPELCEYMLHNDPKDDAALAEEMTAAGELQWP